MTNEQERPLIGAYTGTVGGMLGLAFKTSLLTLITLGIYRFWARTRIRRYVWSATSPGNDPFEYTGTGLEKLLGFLVAVVILAVVLGLLQLGLFFFGLSIFSKVGDELDEVYQMLAFQSSILVIFPLILIARYRARRYILSRTRWRGIRFGMDAAAVGYMLRAIGHTLLTMITLGILLPRQTYYLNKFMIDRTWYGDHPFAVDGSWKKLWPAMTHLAIGFVLLVGGSAWFAVGMAGADSPENLNPLTLGGSMTALTVGYVWLLIGMVYYRVRAYSLMAGMTRLGGVRFKALPSTLEVIIKLVGGWVLVSVIAGIGIGVAFLVAMASAGFDPEGMENTASAIILFAGIFVVISLSDAFSKAFVVQPIIRHFVTSTAVMTPSGLGIVRQRQQDDFADADGFADALDVGAAI